jgi:hypothetical protein
MLLIKALPSSDPRVDALLFVLALAFYALVLIGLANIEGV